jgi:NADPH:quinone reductase-like Zn-dependent oxidoreductase
VALPLLSKKRLRVVALKPNKDLGYMSELVESGSVRPVIDSRYPLTDLAAAMKRFGESKHRGKIIITMD